MINNLSFFLCTIISGTFTIPAFSTSQPESTHLQVHEPLRSSGTVGYTISQAEALEDVWRIEGSAAEQISQTNPLLESFLKLIEEDSTETDASDIKEIPIDLRSLAPCNRSEQPPIDVATLQDINWVAHAGTTSPFSMLTFLSDGEVLLNTRFSSTSPYNLRGQYSLGNYTVEGLTPIDLSIQFPGGILAFQTVMKIQETVRGNEFKIALRGVSSGERTCQMTAENELSFHSSDPEKL